MKKTHITLLVLCVMLSGCRARRPVPGATETSNEPPTPAAMSTPTPIEMDIAAIDAGSYPRVDGSTSALPLQVTLACEILDVHCVWMIQPLTTTMEIVPSPRDKNSAEHELVLDIWHNGTHGSYMNLIDAEADLILVARTPSEDETQAAQQAGVELEIRPIALDAFVILANVENPVDSLDREDVRAIYTGEITSWEHFGGRAQIINPYQRNRNSGSQELMEKLIMRGEPMVDAPNMILEGMMGPINALASDPQGIGYSVYFYATYIYPMDEIKLLAVDGVHPTADTIADRSYPLTTEVYAVIRADTPPESTTRLLYTWLITEEGQAAVARSGYVPLQASP